MKVENTIMVGNGIDADIVWGEQNWHEKRLAQVEQPVKGTKTSEGQMPDLVMKSLFGLLEIGGLNLKVRFDTLAGYYAATRSKEVT